MNSLPYPGFPVQSFRCLCTAVRFPGVCQETIVQVLIPDRSVRLRRGCCLPPVHWFLIPSCCPVPHRLRMTCCLLAPHWFRFLSDFPAPRFLTRYCFPVPQSFRMNGCFQVLHWFRSSCCLPVPQSFRMNDCLPARYWFPVWYWFPASYWYLSGSDRPVPY